MLELRIDDNFSPELERMTKTLGSAGRVLMMNWAVRVRDQARKNARSKGGRSFWREVSDAVMIDRTDAYSAEIGVHHVAAAQKEYGGIIKAKNRKFLTIPITDEAKRKRAGEFVQKLYTRGKVLGYDDSGKNFHPLFVLVKQTKFQSPQPFMPSGDEMASMGVEEAEHLIDREIV